MLFNRLAGKDKTRVIQFQDLTRHVTDANSLIAGFPGEKPKEGQPEIDDDVVEREAFQKGFEAGRNAGMELGEKKIDAMLNRFSRSLDELSSLRIQIMKEMEHDLARLAIEIAKKLVHREVNVDEEIILTLVRVALDKVVRKAPVTVYLNPQDYRHLEIKLAETSSLLGEREIILKEKPDLSRGDCVLESPYGDIDARISEQFKQIEHNFIAEF